MIIAGEGAVAGDVGAGTTCRAPTRLAARLKRVSPHAEEVKNGRGGARKRSLHCAAGAHVRERRKKPAAAVGMTEGGGGYYVGAPSTALRTSSAPTPPMAGGATRGWRDELAATKTEKRRAEARPLHRIGAKGARLGRRPLQGCSDSFT